MLSVFVAKLVYITVYAAVLAARRRWIRFLVAAGLHIKVRGTD